MACGAMILAAGRGERMRPLSDACPKPLLEVGGKALIVWQIEALARAGFTRIVVNAAHLAPAMVAQLGDGSRLGVTIAWSIEPEALETAGGIATALPLLPAGPVLVVSADIHTDFDYATLKPRAARMAEDPATARVHLVMVDNPPYHPAGDFALVADAAGRDQRIARDGSPRLTYANIGLYDTALFGHLPRHSKLKLLPLLHAWIAQGIVSGERHAGHWANVGTPDDLARLDLSLRSSCSGRPPVTNATTST
jgi:N-acetyl-alpha-D-muramate 1-phosphate uridylyltransferase